MVSSDVCAASSFNQTCDGLAIPIRQHGPRSNAMLARSNWCDPPGLPGRNALRLSSIEIQACFADHPFIVVSQAIASDTGVVVYHIGASPCAQARSTASLTASSCSPSRQVRPSHGNH